MASRIFPKSLTRTAAATHSHFPLPLATINQSSRCLSSTIINSTPASSIHHNTHNTLLTNPLHSNIRHISHRYFSITPEEDSHDDFKAKRKAVSNAPSSETTSTTTETQQQRSTSPVASDRDINSLNENEIQELIENDVKSTPIFLYMKGNPHEPRCGFSANVVRILQHINVPFSARDVLSSDKLRNGIKAYSDWPTIPQLYVDGEFVGGSDIITNLFKSGELQKLLSKHVKQQDSNSKQQSSNA